jgi:tetratricopeptide (TPR) repeat protein
MNCQDVDAWSVAERYVLDQLSEPERDAFEEHYYICARCFDEVRILQALPRTASAVARKPSRARTLWLGAAAAIVIIGLVLGSRTWRTPSPSVPVAKQDSRAEALRLLARVEPPRYTPSVLRGSGDPAERQFRTAMQSYSQGDYASAAEGLKSALAGRLDGAAPRFYLGICDLLTGRLDDAIADLRQVNSMGRTLYLEQARFYLAKALLAKQDVAGAVRELELATEIAGDREMEIRRLLEQVRALQASK